VEALIRAETSVGSPAIDEVLAGVPLLLRAALVAQSKGATRVTVAVRVEDRVRAEAVLADPRLRVAIAPASVDAAADISTYDIVCEYDRIADVVLRTTNDRREAKRRLFEACRKPVDGLVWRHLNRHISIAISKLVVDTPISPNAMTAFTFSLSLVAGTLAVRGGYLPTLGAAFLMQWNSILDGCDGELARVRHQGSKLGQWLDTIGDDWSNVIFWATLGVGARAIPSVGERLAWCGYIGAIGNGVAALANYLVLAKLASGDFYALDAGKSRPRTGVLASIVGAIELVLKQDFFLFLMLVLATLGVLHQALYAIALGAVVTAVNSLARTITFFAMRGRANRADEAARRPHR
jgi:phosphatidylglycerophosphate synthase